MTALLPLVMVGPIVVAGLALLTPRAFVRRALGMGATVAVLASAVTMVVATREGEHLATQVGGWTEGVAIAFVADLLSALMLVLTSLLVVVSLGFAAATGEDDDRWFVPLVLVLSAGVYGALLTADLFNLFVAIEVALIPSYVLMSRGASPGVLPAGRLYLVVNLLASTIYLLGVALLYGAAGTVNLGSLLGAGREPEVALAGAVILVALAVKSGLVPVHGWLPRTYPAPSPAVTALFSGLLTKIGVYAVFRVYSVLFDGEVRWGIPVLVVAGASMLVGVLGALGGSTVRGVLAFHMVSQMGYIVVVLGFGTPAALAAGIFYLLTYTMVKTSLFLSMGVVEHRWRTGRIDRLGGIARRDPLLGATFFAAAMSLVGVPPMVGFIAKYAVVRAGFETGHYVVTALAVVVSLLTLLSMMKLWNGVFWGDEPPAEVRGHEPDGRAPVALVLPGLVLAALALGVGLVPQPFYALAEQAAAGLADPTAYSNAVVGEEQP